MEKFNIGSYLGSYIKLAVWFFDFVNEYIALKTHSSKVIAKNVLDSSYWNINAQNHRLILFSTPVDAPNLHPWHKLGHKTHGSQKTLSA